ncbi:MAG TPA: PAS domain S-box protein [Verrucomicrobiae bacterium]|nr:PAS domain S-box protein [Verrucomicrobiae bacterium]
MPGNTLRILLVEDELDYAHAVKELLSSPTFHITHAVSFQAVRACLERECFDLALVDLMLPDSAGLKTFSDFHALAPQLPVIVVTGIADETLALRAVREGAQDYLVKGQLDGKTLERSIRYAIERRRAEHALRKKDEFFRLISENVSDLIAVLDSDGRRVYNSPSYRSILGDPAKLIGTNSFEEVHPQDRERIAKIFENTVETGHGVRTEYRMLLKDGTVRHIESQGNIMQDDSCQPSRVVVVSRDITEHKTSVEVLREALSDLKRAHEELKATQLRLVQAEKIEAVSTFAAGVAHEVKNPLQTILMGLEYLSRRLPATDKLLPGVIQDMEHAVKRADGIIRGLTDFAQHSKREVREENVSAILKQAIAAIEPELNQHPILLSPQLADQLPLITVDFRALKHVFINLLMRVTRGLQPEGGRITVRTHQSSLERPLVLNGKTFHNFQLGDTALWAEIEVFPNRLTDDRRDAQPQVHGLGLSVLKKIIELYNGVMETTQPEDTGGTRYVVVFKGATKQPESRSLESPG